MGFANGGHSSHAIPGLIVQKHLRVHHSQPHPGSPIVKLRGGAVPNELRERRRRRYDACRQKALMLPFLAATRLIDRLSKPPIYSEVARGRLAQLAEQRTLNPCVRGSTPRPLTRRLACRSEKRTQREPSPLVERASYCNPYCNGSDNRVPSCPGTVTEVCPSTTSARD